MRKLNRIFSVLLTIILSVSLCCACQAEEKTDNDFMLTMEIDNPVMTINGTEQNIDENATSPVIQNGRTLVPIRAIIEAMGGKVDWNQGTQTTTLSYNSDKIDLIINSTTAYLNGAENTLDTAPVVINNRTMLPIRFIAESFKFDVEWNQETQTVTIKKSADAAEENVEPLSDAIEEAAMPETNPSKDNKALVVYYSATGSTERVANYIAEAVNADIFEIEPVNPYTSADLNWNDNSSRVTREHENEDERFVELVSATLPDWESYDTVFIGYPIWWGIAAWPVNGFIEANDFTGKTIIPFCTSASSGLGESGKLLEESAGTGNWLEGRRFSSGASESDVKEWTEGTIDNNN